MKKQASLKYMELIVLNSIQGCSRMGDGGGGGKKFPLPIICHSYPTMMKFGTVIPYLKKTQKL